MYDGIEVDMLSLGNADCILVSFWKGFSVYRVLIDGGKKGDAPTVRKFLRSLRIDTIDDLLSTHHHDDHSGGLIELLSDETLKFGKVWSHVPQRHVGSMEKVQATLKAAGSSLEAANLLKSLQTASEIYRITKKRGFDHEEPFKGKKLGPLEVCSPTPEFYNDLVAEFTDVEKIKAEDAAKQRYELQTDLEEAFAGAIFGKSDSYSPSLLDEPHSSPENESSVVSGVTYNKQIYLFTADAGTCALTNVLRDYAVKGLHWMQIPHHGSRRNITKALINAFAPKIAYVSAEGSRKHPRRAVVNAFKEAGASVYSTHYPNGADLWSQVGAVPTRTGYHSATALYEAEKAEKKAEPDWSTGLATIMGGKR